MIIAICLLAYLLVIFLLFAILHGGTRKPSPRWEDEPKLPLDSVYYVNRYGVYRYDNEEVRRLALEFDLIEREKEWR